MSTSQFTEVITASDLVSPPPHSNDKFTTIITETSLLEEDTPQPPIPYNDIVEYYNQMFLTLEEYQNFINATLKPWQNTLKFKYFNSMYWHQRSTTESIKRLRAQAQKLLDEANQLQERKSSTKQELERHLYMITRSELWKRLSNPVKIHPQPPFPRVRKVSRLTPNSPSSASHLRQTTYSNLPRIWQPIGFWCFQCDSPHHIKWDCRQYHCRICKIVAPGHSQKDCPEKNLQHEDNGQRGYHDTYGFEDSNLTGECWNRL